MADLGGLLPTNSLSEDILFEIDCLEDAVSLVGTVHLRSKFYCFIKLLWMVYINDGVAAQDIILRRCQLS